MKKEFLSLLILIFLVLAVVSSSLNYSSADPQGKKTRPDYMTTILERNARPLGLRDNPALRKFLSQPVIKWTIRSEERHILN